MPITSDQLKPNGAFIFGDTYDFIRNQPGYQGPAVVIGADDAAGTGATLVMSSDSNDANVPTMEIFTSQGTLAVPEATQNGNILFQQVVYGFDGEQFQAAGLVGVTAADDGSTGKVPGKIELGAARSADGVLIYAVLDGMTGGFAQPAPASSPASMLVNGQISFYLDEITNKLKIAVKYSDGTTKTGEIALT